MARLFAFGAYAIQSLTAIAAVLAAGAILPASEYGAYSLAVATAQTVSILAFEWLRLGAARLVAAPDETAERAGRLAAVRFAFAAAALPVAVALPLTGLILAGPAFSKLGALAAILIGFGDLRITLIRYRGDLCRSAVLQIIRSFLLLGGAVAGAMLGTAETAFAGLAAAHVTVALVIAAADREGPARRGTRASREDLRGLARYGGPAAIASGIHLLIPLCLRWALSAAADPIRFAGIALAIDLLQRPFAAVFTALTGVFLPAAFQERERADGSAPARARLQRAHLFGGAGLLAAMLGLLPFAARLLVDTPLRPDFLAAAPAAILFFACHGWVQNSLPIGAMLNRDGRALVRNAALEAGLTFAAALFAALASGGDALPILWAAAAGAALSLGHGAHSAAGARRGWTGSEWRLRSR